MKQLLNRPRLRVLCHLAAFLLLTPNPCAQAAAAVALDRTLKPPPGEGSEEISVVLKDMGVVQRKGMNKARKLLLSSYVGMDFSDGPFSMYSVNFDVGYALSDFWEIYLNAAPFYINSRRSIVDKVEGLTLQNGAQATITAALAKRQFGAELLWAPLYGKDSFGIRTVIRSDTFLKAGVSQVYYDTGDTGLRLHLGAGKTYFLGGRVGLRLTVSGNYQQTIVDQVKSFVPIIMVETGLVFYMF